MRLNRMKIDADRPFAVSGLVFTIFVVESLTKDDLAQINRSYLQSLEKEIVIDVACKLRDGRSCAGNLPCRPVG